MLLDTQIAIGKIRTDSIGQLKFPNFPLLIDLAKQSNLDRELAESFIAVDATTPFRVGPESKTSVVFSFEINGKLEVVAQINQPFDSYLDASHKGVQGRGWTVWVNGDFEQPFTPDLILSHLGWNRLVKYLAISGRAVDTLVSNDELAACGV